MNRIQVNTNWYLDEFVDPVTYFTEPDNGLSKLDPSLFDLAQLLRDKFGNSISINGWWKRLPVDTHVFDPVAFLRVMEAKKVPVWSGLRTSLCNIGAQKSAHKLGKAIDPKGDEKVFMQIVRENAPQFYALGLRRLEDISITNGWLHMDTHSVNCKPNSIRVIDKTKCTETIYL